MLTETPGDAIAQAAPETAFVSVPLKQIEVTGSQPRKRFDQAKLDELTENVRKNGILQPILLRPRKAKGYQLVAGERRLRAAGAAGLHTIPAIVRPMTDPEMLELQIVENLHRDDLHELEEAEGYERLMKDHGYTVESLVAKVGKSRSYVYGRLKLTALCPAAREAFYAGELSASTAFLVARIPTVEAQAKATKEISAPYGRDQPLSYRAAADHVQRLYMLQLQHAPFPVGDADLVPAAGSCKSCPKRSGNDRDLFPDVSRADVCTDPECHESKRLAHIERLREKAEASGRTVLTGKDAKKVLEGQILKPGYVDVTEQDYSLTGKNQGKTLKQVLGKDAPETMLVETPEGKLREVAKKSDVKAALEAKGIETTQSKTSRDSGKEDERKAKREAAYRQALLDEILEQLGEQKYYALEPLAQHTFGRLWHDAQQRVLKRRGWGKDSAALEISRMTAEQHYYFIIECALIDEVYVNQYQLKNKPERMNALAATLKIDTAAVRKRVLDELTKAAKDKAAGKGASAKVATSAKRVRRAKGVPQESPAAQAAGDADQEANHG